MSTIRKRIGFDVDGVLADFVSAFTGLAVDLGVAKEVTMPENQQSWEFDFDTNLVWKTIKATPNWWMTLEPLVTYDEIVLLNKLIESNSVYFITNRGRTRGLGIEDQTRHWLHSMGIKAEHVIATKRKGALAKALDLQWFVEDSLTNLQDIQDNGVLAIARQWPHNKQWTPYTTSLVNLLDRQVVTHQRTDSTISTISGNTRSYSAFIALETYNLTDITLATIKGKSAHWTDWFVTE